MIRNISFLLIVLLVSACGTPNDSQFSKRKHLKGHFWNLKEKYKNTNSNSDSKDSSVSQIKKNKDKSSEEILATAAAEEIEFGNSEESLVDSEEVEEPKLELAEKTEFQTVLIAPTIKQDSIVEADRNPEQWQVPSEPSFNFAYLIFFLIALMFWAGIIGLIITLFLQIFSTVIPWLFFASLIAFGVPVLLFFIAVLFA